MTETGTSDFMRTETHNQAWQCGLNMFIVYKHSDTNIHNYWNLAEETDENMIDSKAGAKEV